MIFFNPSLTVSHSCRPTTGLGLLIISFDCPFWWTTAIITSGPSVSTELSCGVQGNRRQNDCLGSVPAIPDPQSPLDPQHRTGTTMLYMSLRWHQVPQAFLLSSHITVHGCPRCQLALEGPLRALEPAGAASEAVRPRQQLPRGITSFHQDTLESPSPHTDQHLWAQVGTQLCFQHSGEENHSK